MILWAHPGTGKTFLYQSQPELVIDVDSVYKSRIIIELGIPDTYEARQLWRKTHQIEYNNRLLELFNEAVVDSHLSGKWLLVSDLLLLRECESDLDLISTMSEETFIARSIQRNEPYDDKHRMWKQDIDECIKNVKNKDKILTIECYLSELFR